MIILLTTAAAHGQSLQGVPIAGSLQTCMAGFEKQGFTYVKKNPLGVTMSGKMFDRPVELYIVVTPKTRTVCKVAVYFPKRTDRTILENKYQYLKKILIKALGTPDLQEEKFLDPYKPGTSRESEALTASTDAYSSFWMGKGNTNTILEISEFSQVYMAVENKRNMEWRERER